MALRALNETKGAFTYLSKPNLEECTKQRIITLFIHRNSLKREI